MFDQRGVPEHVDTYFHSHVQTSARSVSCIMIDPVIIVFTLFMEAHAHDVKVQLPWKES